MLDINFQEFPVINTTQLILRQFSHTDADKVFELRSNEAIMRFIKRPRAKTVNDAKTWIDTILNSFKNNEGITWAITLKDAPDIFIGSVGFWRIIKEHHRAEIGYMLHADYWGKGIIKEATEATIEYGFKQLNFHSIEAHIDPENIASGKLLEKTGFTKEAFHKDNFYFEGKFYDTEIYSLINPYHSSL
ncbi:GNAT family N-acetyltransferase [Solitalea canadensis]|uniref:Acetyltransferase, ribosomal protein N-acetylase n=1 Tax=Solitalea canadensis (strain ATCC 29591 / DSM 3403 / JCM 21819 / LMG 8368 / NBRC 15130 / NCIMB 12057 / USAM 9D) TaxID=929556 RepID=H8KTL2_SOLCM|nr:GNAT family N-acetyltransferase [Solitalea canadensis]AFD06470.1 acetyltransferase, ribosomal protein N-acetylase [Solitalea canadensis DSM 3403]